MGGYARRDACCRAASCAGARCRLDTVRACRAKQRVHALKHAEKKKTPRGKSGDSPRGAVFPALLFLLRRL
jgi:hypothetical protein